VGLSGGCRPSVRPSVRKLLDIGNRCMDFVQIWHMGSLSKYIMTYFYFFENSYFVIFYEFFREFFAKSSSDFFSETAGPIRFKFGMRVSYNDGYQVCSNCADSANFGILAEFNLEICSVKGLFPMQSEWGRIFDFFSETA
jgi:hypothetical protein